MGILPKVKQNEPIEKERKVSSEKFGANLNFSLGNFSDICVPSRNFFPELYTK